ncbi:D-alanyl-D-alanine carboxypeptidase family protein [Halodurantibacterium flavum]|uniref:serine-type D-Ala-D-Ala carboxypeptidase n=1 Tax=Halodurantibacterium flavum TaxID=1382802 RepID=A0ABW4S602_9RHOB
MISPILRLCAVMVAALVGMAPASAFETRATAAYVIDYATGTVLLEKNADQPLPPASMSKLMTLNMLFEAIDDGRVTMDTPFSVSSRARAMGGSTMFLNEMDRPTVRELILGIVVNSGNDACVVVAEGLAGSEEAFARLMTERAQALGMVNTSLRNASGWPADGHVMSMRDLALLTMHMINDFPELYAFFNEREYDYKERSPANRFNRNPLFRVFPESNTSPDAIHADGLKTGHTMEAGYGLVGSAVQGDRRVIFVITGLQSEQERSEEAERIVNWAFRQFVQRTVARQGERIAEADVWLGEETRVGLTVESDRSVLVPAMVQQEGLEARVVYHGPVQAPIAAGQKVADLVVSHPEMNELRIPLVAETAVERGGFVARLRTAATVLFHRAAGGALNGLTGS